jgi:hypothetical protein
MDGLLKSFSTILAGKLLHDNNSVSVTQNPLTTTLFIVSD